MNMYYVATGAAFASGVSLMLIGNYTAGFWAFAAALSSFYAGKSYDGLLQVQAMLSQGSKKHMIDMLAELNKLNKNTVDNLRNENDEDNNV